MLQNNFKTRDDLVSIVQNENVHHFRLKEVLGASFFDKGYYYRPLVSLSYMIEYFFFKTDAFYYYLNNVLLHIASALVVLVLMRHFLKDILLSFAVALLFAVHPIQWEAVANISGRAILLNTFFLLLSFLTFILARDKKKFMLVSPVLFLLALLSKESAGVFPLLLCCYQFVFPATNKDSWLVKMKPVFPFLGVACVYVLVRHSLGITRVLLWPDLRQAALGFLTFLKGVMIYGRLIIFPAGLHFDRSLKIVPSFFSAEAQVYLLIIIVFLLIRFRRRLPTEIKFFVLWILIELIPVCQIPFALGAQKGYISMAEHFLYAPSVPLFALVAMGGRYVYAVNREHRVVSKFILNAIMAGFLIFFYLSTIQHNIYAKNERAMFERTLTFNPQNIRIRNSLAGLQAQAGRIQAAQENYTQVLTQDPFNVQARIGLARTLCAQGRLWDCLAEYEKVRDPGVYENLLEKNIELTYQALEQKYKRAVKLEPQAAENYFSLGLLSQKKQDDSKAVSYFLKAGALNPNFKENFFHLGLSYENMGQFDEALEAYSVVIAQKDYSEFIDRQTCLRAYEIFQNLGEPQEYEKFIKEILQEMGDD